VPDPSGLRRFSFEALISSLAAQAPGVTAEHHPLMGSSVSSAALLAAE
jgi:hypothetical protein